jgi:hypothetical protein
MPPLATAGDAAKALALDATEFDSRLTELEKAEARHAAAGG